MYVYFVKMFVILLIYVLLRINSLTSDLLDYWYVSTKLNFRDYSHYRDDSDQQIKRSISCIQLELLLKPYENLTLCIYAQSVMRHDCVRKNSMLNHFTSKSFNSTPIYKLNLESAGGFVMGYESSSTIDGYIFRNEFYGKVLLENHTYYVEDKRNILKQSRQSLGCKNLHPNAVVYENISFTNIGCGVRELDYNFSVSETHLYYKKESAPYKSRFCSLEFYVDPSYYVEIAFEDPSRAVHDVIQMATVANSIFRSTDLSGDNTADNVGFYIASINLFVNDDISPLHRKFNGAMDSSSESFFSYLTQFAQLPALKKVCLGVALTAQRFADNVQGISYTAALPQGNFYYVGGICTTNYFGPDNNALIVSAHGNARQRKVMDLVLAHELGHSFGASHDLQYPCRGYLMEANIALMDPMKRHHFSICSMEMIHEILMERYPCLEKHEKHERFCGNHIAEFNEDCDCGSKYNCALTDQCCIPYDNDFGARPCTVNRHSGYECHPSQGYCCEDDCTYTDLSYLGLTCELFDSGCPCHIGRTAKKSYSGCRCGINGICGEDELCHSVECERINLRECACPELEDSECHTCCEINGTAGQKECIPAIDATQQVAFKTDLSRFQIMNLLPSKMQAIKQFCNENNTCANLSFWHFPLNEYCLWFGHLGRCQENGNCQVPRVILHNLKFASDCSIIHQLSVYLVVLSHTVI